jgi:hypothetical protein
MQTKKPQRGASISIGQRPMNMGDNIKIEHRPMK